MFSGVSQSELGLNIPSVMWGVLGKTEGWGSLSLHSTSSRYYYTGNIGSVTVHCEFRYFQTSDTPSLPT